MARYLVGSPLTTGRLGILPAAFNPPTNAHLALADAAAAFADLDQVAFTLPEKLPHKTFHGAAFEQRVAMLEAVVDAQPSRAAAVAEGGLFIDMAREFRTLCGPDVEIYLICGSDAADRIVRWDYVDGPPFSEQLQEFSMLVGSRGEHYQPPSEYRRAIRSFDLPADYAAVSSTAAREQSSAAVPQKVAELIKRWGLYH